MRVREKEGVREGAPVQKKKNSAWGIDQGYRLMVDRLMVFFGGM